MSNPGLARIVCTAGSATATALVLVRPGNRRVETDTQWGRDQGSATATSGPGGSVRSAPLDLKREAGRVASLLSSAIAKLSPTVEAQNGGGGSGSAWTTAPWVIGTPRNGVIEPTRFGAVLPESFNYELSIPVVASLGNRELNLPLALYYNSNIWSVTGPTTLQFDPNQSWPCPGFSMGLGRIDTVMLPDGVTAQYTLVDPNGTRHYLGSGPASVTGAPPPYPIYTTSDGTYISYIGDAVHGGELYSPSGTKYDINLINNRLQVSQITTPNGNYVTASYMQNSYDQNGNPIPPVYSPFALNYVTDTLGREINFGYDTSSGTGLLTSISGPAGGATLTYQQKALSYNFVSNQFGQMTVQGAPSTYFALTAISAQQNYQMTYSGYGMVYSFTMGRSNTATVTFDYPTSGSTQLGGAPAFTQRTETSGTTNGTYSYSVSNGVSTITRPDTSTLTLTDNGSGLLAQSEIKLGTKSYAKMVYSHGTDPGGATQVTSVQAFDDTGTPRRIDYAYDQHGNVTSKLEYGFQVNGAWQVQRKTALTYQGSPYTDNHMLNLVTSANIYDGSNNQVAGTSYAYDGYGGTILEYKSQGNSVPGHLSTYDSTYTLRGNPTTVTRLTDVTSGASTGRSAEYDVFGNEVQVQVSCCNQKTFTYGIDTYFSQPDQTTSGGSGTSLSNNATYNFNTSAMTSKTDPNGLTTNVSSNSWLQPTQVVPPTGASISLGYDDWGFMDSQSVSYSDGGVNKSFSASVTRDGWGNPVKQFDASGNEIDLSYDNMGRLISRTNPFHGTPGPATSYQYDTLGRAISVTLPDGNKIQTAYSGSTATRTDPVERQIRYKSDGLGRLIEVDEQDPVTGALTQVTTYTYNLLNKLTEVLEGAQKRLFKYDAAGRMTYENVPEQTATINDGTGTMWTCKYSYTDFDAIATKTDARGVVITNSFDGMNRLIGVSYNTSNAPGVASTPSVAYNYDNSTTSTTKGLLLSVSVGSFYSESYSYDSLNREASITDTIDSRAYTTHFQYNQANQPTQLTYPDNRVLPYVYDSFGRLSSIGGSSGNPTGYLGNIGYSVADQVTGFSLGNGVQEAFTYDQNRLLLTSNVASKGSTSLMNVSFSYAAQAGQMGTGTTAGNTAELVGVSGTINGQTESASYNNDLNGRLTSFSQTSNGQNAGRAYSWDRWGNRVSETDTIANAQIQSVTLPQSGGAPTNRISSVSTNGGSPVSYQYDNAGNVTGDGVNTYTYDARDRLAAVSGGAAAQYAYDFRSCRVKKTVAGGLTHYVWLAGHVLAEFDGNSGSDLADYILHGSAYIAKVTAAGTVYMLRDWANTRLELDSNGAVVGAMGTTAFGEDFAESGQQEKYHFTNYERDQETGLDYALNRTYSQTLGRFEQADPYHASGYLVDPQSWNRYSYARGNPVGRVDTDGLDDHNGSWSGGGSSGPWDCTNCSVTVGAGPNALIGSGAGGAGESNALPEENAGGADGGGGLTFKDCQTILGQELAQKLNLTQVNVPTADQYAMAQQAATSTGVDANLLLSTWYIETGFGGSHTANNLRGPAYGPMQLGPATANQFLTGTGYTIGQVLGDQSSNHFTGDVQANLTVGGFFLAFLQDATGGDEALAGAAYLGQNAVLGKDPSQLTGAYLARYNEYQQLLGAFDTFNKCAQGKY